MRRTKRRCIICQKRFEVGRNTGRTSRAITCSGDCSKILTRIYVRIRNRRLDEAIKNKRITKN